MPFLVLQRYEGVMITFMNVLGGVLKLDSLAYKATLAHDSLLPSLLLPPLRDFTSYYLRTDCICLLCYNSKFHLARLIPRATDHRLFYPIRPQSSIAEELKIGRISEVGLHRYNIT